MAKPEAVELEVAGHTVRITNPDKVFFPARGETKLDLARYYLAVGDGAAARRVRTPDGAEAVSRRRHRRAVLPEAGAGEPARVARDRAWSPSRAGARPTSCARSTSPTSCGRSTSVASTSTRGRCGATTSTTPTSCGSTSIRSPACPTRWSETSPRPSTRCSTSTTSSAFPKTSGSRGIHVNVRIEPRWDFLEVRRAALALGRAVERKDAGARDVEVVEGGAGREGVHRLQPERP